MNSNPKRLPKETQQEVQLAYESLNDWHTASDLVDTRRPRYVYALIFCFFAVIGTLFELGREYLLWLIGRLGIVAIWFGAISLFLLYVNSFRRKRQLETLIDEAKAELRAHGLDYSKPSAKLPGELRSRDPDGHFDPYDDHNFE